MAIPKEEHTETSTASQDKTVSQPSSRLELRLADGLGGYLREVDKKLAWRARQKELINAYQKELEIAARNPNITEEEKEKARNNLCRKLACLDVGYGPGSNSPEEEEY